MADLMPEKVVAVKLGRSLETLRRWRRTGWAPPFYRLGGCILYRWAEVEIWLEAQRQ